MLEGSSSLPVCSSETMPWANLRLRSAWFTEQERGPSVPLPSTHEHGQTSQRRGRGNTASGAGDAGRGRQGILQVALKISLFALFPLPQNLKTINFQQETRSSKK